MSKDKGKNYEESKKKSVAPTETEITRQIEGALEEEAAWVKYVEQFGDPVEGFLPSLFDENGQLKQTKAETKKIIEKIQEADDETNLNSGL